MSTTTDAKQSRRQKPKEPKPYPVPSGTERLKTVVRRLPPNLPEEIFWQSVQAWVTDDTVTWRSYCPGKLRTKRPSKEGIPSRAYIAFKNEEQVATFSREYDGHLFKDKAGNESQAVVEFAPFQKVPTEKKKVDARNNTIDKDEDYLSFLETLKNTAKTESVSVSLETLIAASQPPPPPTTTPLLEALKAEKSAQKDKEAILRNHAHYKDAAASGASLKKEEAKKKAAAIAKQQESPAPLSKKAKKAVAAAAAAAQKASSTQAQDGQGPPGKSQPVAAPSSVKPPAPTSTTGHAPRHRSLKEPHGRPHLGKGDTSTHVPVAAPASASGPGPTPPLPVATENAAPGSLGPLPVHGQGQRKSRPVIGLGRQFEAALSGAGVAVAPGSGGDRKKRDKGGESGSGAGGTAAGTEGGGKGGKHRHREGHTSNHGPAAVVPSILQREEAGGGGGATPDVVIMQRSSSPQGPEEGHTEGPGPGPGTARGSARRGRGRGRGGHRGG